jgi:DNA-binding NarL/FixJ family response regulator
MLKETSFETFADLRAPEPSQSPRYGQSARHLGARRAAGPLGSAVSAAERRALVTLDETESQRLQLASLWPALCEGRLRFSKVFEQGTREYALLEESHWVAGPPLALDARQVRMIERLVVGSSQKVIGIDLEVAASTVSMHLGSGLTRLGLQCCVSRLPLSFNLIVLAPPTAGGVARARVSEYAAGKLLVSVAWPKQSLLGRLSSSERAVTELMIAGLTNREISRHRGTSMRTVANQLASIFAKFKLSGRLELMAHLATHTLRTEPPEAAISTVH